MSQALATTSAAPRSVLVDMSGRYGMEPGAFEATVRATCMPDNGRQQATREEFAAFLLVAREYKLNPITKEIYAFPRKGGGIVPIVSIDGWISLVNSHPACDGFDFAYEHDDKGKLVSCTGTIYRNDRGRPVIVTEYLSECVRDTQPWKMQHRMLRHKAMIQAARYAFGFSGIYDEDEAIPFTEFPSDAPPRRVSKGPPPAPQLSGPVTAVANDAVPAKRAAAREPDPIADVEHTPVVSQGAAADEAGKRDISIEGPKAHYAGMAEPADDTVDLAETLEGLTEKLAHATTINALEEMYDDFGAEEVLAEIEGGAVAARKVKDAALARIQNAMRPAREITAAPADPADPFAIPEGFESGDDYVSWLETVRKAVTDEATAKRLTDTWKATKAARGELVESGTLSESTIRALQATITKFVGQFKPKAAAAPAPEPVDPEPKPVDLDAVPTTKAEYLALIAARAKIDDFPRIQNWCRFWGRDQDLRDQLGVTEAEYTPAKRALWARVDELRPDDEA